MDFTEQIRLRAFQRQRENPHIYGNESVSPDHSALEPMEKKNRIDHCKSRLAMLASEINQREDDVQHLSSRPKNAKSDEINATVSKGFNVPESKSQKRLGKVNMKPRRSNSNNRTSANKKPPAPAVSISKRDQVLDNNILRSLEAQGFSRSESGAHLLYEYKKPQQNSDENIEPKTTTIPSHPTLEKKQKVQAIPKKQEIKARGVTRDNSYRMSSVARDSITNDLNGKDPVLLSVAERMRLFESKMKNSHVSNMKSKLQQAAVTRRKVLNNSNYKKEKDQSLNIVTVDANPTVNTEVQTSKDALKFKKYDEYVEPEAISSPSHEIDVEQVPHLDKEPKKPTDCIHHNNSADLVDTPQPILDISTASDNGFSDSPKACEILKTLKQVKFSTPKPGHLYPSLDIGNSSDNDNSSEKDDRDVIDGIKADSSLESLSITSDSDNNLFSDNNLDHSFGREVFSATKDIFSSYSNSKDAEFFNNVGSESIDSVSKLNKFISDLNNKQCPGSCSPSPAKRSRDGSCVTGEEVSDMSASFTYLQKLNDSSSDSSGRVIKIENGCVVVNTCNSSSLEEDEKTKITKRISDLEEMIQKERSVAIQTVQALNLCISIPKYLYSTAHLEAEKLLLLSHHRSAAAQVEIDRLKVEKLIHATHLPNGDRVTRGQLTISDIKVPIKMSVINDDTKDSMCNYLLCLIKCEELIYASSVIPVTNENILQSINPNFMYILFQEKFVFPNIYSDFKIVIEVYNLFVESKIAVNQKTPNSAKKGHLFKFSAKKGKEGQASPNVGGQQRIPDGRYMNSSFYKLGNMIFSINETHRNQFILTQKHVYHNPLVGVIQMKIDCEPVIHAEYHGFLTMYEVISGFGAWSRYWFHHYGDRLSYWKYPDEEQTQPPIDTLNLRNCVTKIVDTVGIDICARPHTFSLTFTENINRKGNQDSASTKRYLLSSDNVDERINWCQSLNNVLGALHMWRIVLQHKGDNEESDLKH